ncbi:MULTISPECIES: glycerate kinase type-2 family protein [Alphaproteobacteria]|uniref:Hydroxypyruvate reductase n=2 Tax=Alphaproteobacteria TaxID=28211 RepID=A0A512HIP5_9HYPH|nr:MULTISPECIES: glycerate kinase [Alphaproteobacteria]GEO85304.1 hydroxypyruvate reductase [Ciceribacter naphthalenivorans]GLR20943.1 hydroxypyruvate reductase [Ciceribacter naphthalenivorans]GLT03799.1 hydroxypyruvate reductase [Sphingomonas psychrolutea]
MTLTCPRAFLASLFDAAVLAADPYAAIKANLPEKPKGRTVVIGAGKAASQMAAAFEALWEGPLDGLVVARHGPVEHCEHITVMQSAHPVPDEAGLHASEALLNAVEGLSEDDLVVALISGGGSALLPAPPAGLTLDDEIAVNKALLASGAPISAMNTVRKHVSRIKGGRLAAACAPARVVSLIVSDVPGDNPAFVASGPTVPSTTSPHEALAIIAEYGMRLPASVMAHLKTKAAEAPDPADPAFARNEVHVIASARVSLEAAAKKARQIGVPAVILSDAIEGEARDIGRMHAAIAREVQARDRPFAKPVVILSGGETTVTISSDHYGKGGRNSELLLSLALDIEGTAGLHALAADTDGIDGSENNAGAFADGTTAARIRAAGGDPQAYLAGHDAWSAFSLADGLFVPGATGTNVNDFRAILVTDD